MNPQQAVIWTNILQFDLDQPISEYGFSTRLAYENGWSFHFTKRAITEYKKFMFLAGTSSEMVSPSPVVDIVWHQHLIFTQSYKVFCDILGKRIEHVPSRHNYMEKAKFETALSYTHNKYREFWDEPPADIWLEQNELSELDKSQNRASASTWVNLVASIFLIGILYYPISALLKPYLIEIENPHFLIGYCAGFGLNTMGAVWVTGCGCALPFIIEEYSITLCLYYAKL